MTSYALHPADDLFLVVQNNGEAGDRGGHDTEIGGLQALILGHHCEVLIHIWRDDRV